VNEEKLGVDALQVMTHHFCFGHQTVYSPTSLPTPVYVALEYVSASVLNFHFLMLFIFRPSVVETYSITMPTSTVTVMQ
jgi:hypothetical protein